MTTYKEVTQYLFSQFPQYQKIGKKAYKADLTNIKELVALLDYPEKKLNCVHVAGTNGKGSVSHLMGSILQEAGYKVGIFTSPHLIDFKERIKINGKTIDEEFIIDFVNKHKLTFEKLGISFFEWTTALAFCYFEKQKTDVCIIETGLGGRLDSTNIINPILSVITTIGLDHQNILGQTIEEIAYEKGGIIKENTPVVVGPQIKESFSVLAKLAESRNARITKANATKRKCELLGNYQYNNIGTALNSIEKLVSFNIKKLHIEKGLQNVIKNTGIRGRWELLMNKPMVIAEIGHNEQAFEAISNQLKSTPFKKGIAVLSFSDDKDLSKIINKLPKTLTYYLTESSSDRAMKCHKLKSYFSSHKTTCFTDYNEAYKTALEKSNEEDLIFIGGSAFLVGDILSDFFSDT
jgi:dihydrofolate synthase / folylpolyglutamate synthase